MTLVETFRERALDLDFLIESLEVGRPADHRRLRLRLKKGYPLAEL
jgi:hypothetical protein